MIFYIYFSRLILLLSFILMLVSCPQNPYSGPRGNIGNLLNEWLIQIGTNSRIVASWMVKTNLRVKDSRLIAKNDIQNSSKNLKESILEFYNLLDQVAPEIDDIKTKKMLEAFVEYYPDYFTYNWDLNNTVNGELFWAKSRSFLNELLSTVFEKLKLPKVKLQNDPILHFRCSDIPFVNHEDYHFIKYNYFDWVKGKILSDNYSHWYIITACGHGINDDKKDEYCNICKHYLNSLQEYINDKLEVSTTVLQNRSALEDFASFFFAPILISATSSSLSFMAGVASDGKYFTPANVREYSNGSLLIYQPKNILSKDKIFIKSLVESDILKNYDNNWFDFETVINKMKNNEDL